DGPASPVEGVGAADGLFAFPTVPWPWLQATSSQTAIVSRSRRGSVRHIISESAPTGPGRAGTVELFGRPDLDSSQMRRALSVGGMVVIAAVASACSPVTLGRAVLGLPNSQPTPYEQAVQQVWSANNKMNMTLNAGLPDKSSPSGYFFELVRTSKNASWKIDDWTFLGNVGQKPPIAVNSRGQAAQVSQRSSGGRLLVDPNQLSAAYTQFFVATGNQ